MYDTFIGVDPGKSGAIVVLDEMDPGVPEIFKTDYPLDLYIERFYDCVCANGVAVLEKVHAMPGQGVTSMFTFGRNFGQLEMFLEGLSLNGGWHHVTPQQWQKFFDLFKKEGETKTQKKNRHKKLAKKLFPGVDVTHANADALLIAEYCRRIYGGNK